MSVIKLKHFFAYEGTLPFAMCHASNVLRLTDGSFLTVFFAGSAEGAADTCIYQCRLDADGHMTEAKTVASGSAAHWNPVLFTCSDGSLCLIYKAGDVIARWQSFIMRSEDQGLTWSSARELVPGDFGGRGPVRNKPIVLKSGKILCPASLEEGRWRAFADISTDDLHTLTKGEEIVYEEQGDFDPLDRTIAVSAQSFSGQGVIQPAFWEDECGVHALMRSTYGHIIRADSRNEGQSFGKPYPIAMPNNNSGIDAVYTHGRLYLVCNPIAGNWGRRTPLALFSSEDGFNFTQEAVLEDREGEFSYPCLRAFEDLLYVSYTDDRKNISIQILQIK